MSIAEKLQTIAENEQRVYDAGYLSASRRFLYYGYSRWQPIKMSYIPKEITSLRPFAFAYNNVEEVAILPEHITTCEGNGLFCGVTFVKKIILHNGFSTLRNNFFNGAIDLEEVVCSNSETTLKSGVFGNCLNLKKVTNLGNITSIASNCFQGSTALEYIEFESLKVGSSGVKLNYSSKLTVECLLGILNALVDNTGEANTYTLYLGSTNLAKLTAEQQAIALNKNIELA